MPHRLRISLEPAISTARLESYRNGGDDLDMLVNYFHNLELSEALYPSLQAFEVAYRNSLHDALTARYSTPYWFDHPDFLQSSRHEKSVADVRSGLKRDGKQSPYSADHIVSRLNFGFWHGLLNRPFEKSLWQVNGWQLIATVFPAAPRKQRNRQGLWNQIDHIRILRNRVMHYEPVWNRPHLETDHGLILDTLGWISPDMKSAIAMSDRFPRVYGQGRNRIQNELIRHSAGTNT